jgi:hypothetical protein
MTSVYESLICDLKNKLKNKNINYENIFRLINNKKYGEIIKIIDDETIQSLIDNIISEREQIGNNMEKKLNDVLWLNERLIQFGEEPQSSKTKALKLLKKKVFINIYHLEAEKYEKRTTKQHLIEDIQKNPERCFPLLIAKENITLKCFLIKYRKKSKRSLK